MELDKFLFFCRISKQYKGCRYIRYAIEIINDSEEKCFITKNIYPKIADRYNVSVTSIEHDIRTVVRIIWDKHQDIIKALFGYVPDRKPNNFQFIDAMAFAYRTILSGVNFPNKELCSIA